jgi:type VI secretion system protein ImpE
VSLEIAERSVREGDLAGALMALQDQVRKNPSTSDLRVFLFQLLAVLGEWDRALTQLNVAASR